MINNSSQSQILEETPDKILCDNYAICLIPITTVQWKYKEREGQLRKDGGQERFHNKKHWIKSNSGRRNHFPGLTGGENSLQWNCAKAGSYKTVLPIQGTVHSSLHCGCTPCSEINELVQRGRCQIWAGHVGHVWVSGPHRRPGKQL